MSNHVDDNWITKSEGFAANDGRVWAKDDSVVCQCYDGAAFDMTRQDRAERIAKLPQLGQRAEQAEGLLREVLTARHGIGFLHHDNERGWGCNYCMEWNHTHGDADTIVHADKCPIYKAQLRLGLALT